jgi:uncharacterized membrane protein YfcA
MAKLLARRLVELEALDFNERDGAFAAAVLSAYVHAEQMHVFRRLLWRRLTLMALLWTAGAAATPFISRSGLLAGLGLLVLGGAGVLVLEWRAVKVLQTLLRDRLGERAL